ncbi:hypothetical protein J4U02_gp148 [Mycobacterium phage Aziz]|uniref:Uncharacterized protein n=1 Tax=Mycobacterium phage Aziz TaxID=2762281 RepID=A0A7G8LHP2_9CAUD|nr:hypothetical protein J4U02_gp148 [Mycobacterium phage Aziz]ASR75952.1 hypothetical protein SEA_GENEVAB15_117 [Mycobacterium phage GenevaB15]QNJ56764.1 hypothetical protein SEA_AZIZ_113 [Mycobacterium phage Aziz]
MTEKLKSGVAHKSIVDTVNALIDRIDALEAETPAEEQAAAKKIVRKPKATDTPAE